jgi:LacI family transcriptional regulator
MTTVYDVARMAGVSTATVSRVMRDSHLVQAETRQRVQAVIEALGFVPDATAQGLSLRRKDIIGFVGLERGEAEIDIERESLLFVDQIVHAAEAVLRDTEYSLLLTFGSSGQAFERRVRALSGKVDGLLVAEEVMAVADLRRLAGRIPVAVIAGRPDETGLDVVLVDNTGGITALVAHLAGQHGYQRLCFVTGPPDAPDARERQAAFENAVLASPGCVIDQVVHGDFSEGSGTKAEFQRAGVRIPGDVALTGFDDVYPSRLVDPPLTTVSQPLRELGVRATRRLLARIENRALPPETNVLPTRVMIRASCGCQGRDTT